MSEKISLKQEKIEQLVVFHLGNEEYGIKITDVREIIKTGLITPIPDPPNFISGVINVRGLVIAVLDLKLRFSLHSEKEENESKHVIITQQENNLIGLMVDEVTEVLRLPQKLIKEAPAILNNVNQKYVNGILTLGNRIIIMLDLNKVLSNKELNELIQITKRHQRENNEEESESNPGTLEEEFHKEIEAIKKPAIIGKGKKERRGK